ncbi:MAG: hypothetical protein ABIA63_01855 [bacterium]
MSAMEVLLITGASGLSFLAILFNIIIFRKNLRLDSLIDELERNLDKRQTEMETMQKQLENATEKNQTAEMAEKEISVPDQPKKEFTDSPFLKKLGAKREIDEPVSNSENNKAVEYSSGVYEISTASGEKLEAEFNIPVEQVMDLNTESKQPDISAEDMGSTSQEPVNLYIELRKCSDDSIRINDFNDEIESAAATSPPSLVVDFRNISFLSEKDLSEIISTLISLYKRNIYVYSQNASEDIAGQFRSKNIELDILA